MQSKMEEREQGDLHRQQVREGLSQKVTLNTNLI